MIVKVVRSGGFAGLVAEAELDTSAEPDGQRLEEVARGLSGDWLSGRSGSGRPQPDRYVYRLELRTGPEAEPSELTLAEQDLNQDAAWLLDRVLSRE